MTVSEGYSEKLQQYKERLVVKLFKNDVKNFQL